MADIRAMLQAAAGASGEADENFNQTVLLLHGDGTNGAQNQTFLDSSTNSATITNNGTPTQGSFSPFSAPNGRWSSHFDGTDDYLSLSGNAAFAIATSTTPFTVESWVYITAAGGVIFSESFTGGGDTVAILVSLCNGTSVGTTTGRFVGFGSYSGAFVNAAISTTEIPLNQWTHVACVFTGSTTKIFIDGVDSTASSPTPATTWAVTGDNGDAWYVGRRWSSAATEFLSGYISNLRFVNGSAVYTSAFTPSTAPLTAIANTALLTCQSNYFKDNSSNAFAITSLADATVTSFSPFAPTAAYDPAVNGGSGYFDANTTWIVAPETSGNFTFGTGDFTVECFFYCSSLQRGAVVLLIDARDISGNRGVMPTLYIGSAGQPIFFIGAVWLTSSTNSQYNAWNHVAVVKNSGTIYMYLNGVQVASRADTQTYIAPEGNTIKIGAFDGSNDILGYISNVRIVKGSAVYTSAFSPLTAPLTAVSGTELLLKFENAGIFDNTGKNNLRTVADAQIDTTTKKYGSGSMEFDGTGDWLVVSNKPDLQLGTGDFTIEFWVYLATGDAGSARGLVAKGGASTGWLVSLDSSEKVVFTYTTSTITSSGAITTNAWNHIAVVREGTGSNETKIYINGTNDGTGTVNTDFNQTEVMYIGANRAAGDPMKGFIDDLRITKGIARYTATFTPPDAPFLDQ